MAMSFGAGKNPPWARDAGVAAQSIAQQQIAVAQPVLSQPGVATPTVYSLGNTQPAAIQQQQYTQQLVGLPSQLAVQQVAASGTAMLPQPGIAIPTTLATTQVATVSYPAPRVAQTGVPQQKQRVFTGTVTKLHDNFGFVDEDVFFQVSCVKGVVPKVMDRVLVEASYNASMPFKWNATRIQVLPNQGAPNQGQSSSAYGSHLAPANTVYPKPNVPTITPTVVNQPPPLMGHHVQPAAKPPFSGGQQARSNSRLERLGQNFRDREQRENKEKERERSRHERRERRPSPSSKKVSRSPRRSRSPSRGARSPPRRRAARIVPRYMVQIPKISLDAREANVISIKSRYSNLYVPSDFFHASFSWTDAFPTHRPFQLGHQSSFHVMHKEVDPINTNSANLEPADADHLYSAKVMLLAGPSLEELYHKTCALAEDPGEVRDAFQHPTRLIQFLVGLKGKSEPMAIGGPWSPSLDGKSPEEDPRVLINTAIRTTRALTGIDLSACTQWYRFAEIRYHRPEEMHKGRLVPARVETVVIFLPDVWNCNPTRLDWDALQSEYKQQLTNKMAGENQEDAQEDEEGGEDTGEKKDPSHYSELDPKTMKVTELRRELECRALSSKGLKSQLIARLTKALKTEEEKEQEENENKKQEEADKEEVEEEKMEVDEREEEKKKKEEEDRKRREEREKVARERRYVLPDNPAIVVHPSTTAKSGKFDCTVMSLSVLLDYRPEDNKEHSFEVSLFAELFNEMLMRDFGFRIYKALAAAPEKPKDDKKDRKDRDKEKDSDKEKKDDKDKKKDETSKKDDKDKEKDKDEPSAKRRKVDGKDDHKSETRKSKDKEKSDSEDDDDEEDGDEKDKDKRRKDKDKDKDKKKEKVKFFTMEKEMLLSFVYFDQSHTGYLLDRDVEEILHTIGLHLTRAEVKKLVQKVVTRDTLNYRKLTDKPHQGEPEKAPAEEEPASTKTEEEGKTTEEGKEGKEEKEDSSNSEAVDIMNLARGNNDLLPKSQPMPVKGPSSTGASQSGEETEEGSSNLVMYNGALVDIHSIMQRLEKSEQTRKQTESKLKDLQDEMDEVKDSFDSSEKTGKKVALELSELKKKLREQRRATDKAEDCYKKYKDMLSKVNATLTDINVDVTTVLAAKPKEESSPSESSVKTEVKQESVTNGE